MGNRLLTALRSFGGDAEFSGIYLEMKLGNFFMRIVSDFALRSPLKSSYLLSTFGCLAPCAYQGEDCGGRQQRVRERWIGRIGA